MDPYERWDDWEWERAVQELGHGTKERKGVRKDRGKRSSGSFNFWTGGQRRTALAAVLFLTLFFSAYGDDVVSKGIYSVYQKFNEPDYYSVLTGMAKEAVGLGGLTIDSMPVDAAMKEKFLPPVSGPVEAAFGIVGEGNKTHEGIDVGSSLGTKVVSPYSGVVTGVLADAQLGNVIKLDFGDGWTCVLGNLGDIMVGSGERVEMGQSIGTVGLSAPLKKPWLHIELRKDNKAVNPIPYFIPSR